MRSRNIKPGFFLNDVLAELDPLCRLLFAGLWTVADKEGRLEDRPKKIKAACLPYDQADVDSMLNQLQAKGFLMRYQVKDNDYIQVNNWNKHQAPHYKEVASEIPPFTSGVNVDPTLNQHQADVDPTLAQPCPLIPDSFQLDSLNGDDGLKMVQGWFEQKTARRPYDQTNATADKARLSLLVEQHGEDKLITTGEDFLNKKLQKDGQFPFNIRYLLSCWEGLEQASPNRPDPDKLEFTRHRLAYLNKQVERDFAEACDLGEIEELKQTLFEMTGEK